MSRKYTRTTSMRTHGGDRISKAMQPSVRFVERVLLHLYCETPLSFADMANVFGLTRTGAYLAVQRAKAREEAAAHGAPLSAHSAT